MSAPDALIVKVPPAYDVEPAADTAPTSLSAQGLGRPPVPPPVVSAETVTLSTVAVADALVEWLVTATPTKTLAPIAMVSVPIVVHDAPSADSCAVSVLPLRTRRTQCGGAEADPLVLTDVLPVASRRWNATPFAAETSTSPCAAFAASDSRIITPAFDQALVFCTVSTRIWIDPSPDIGW